MSRNVARKLGFLLLSLTTACGLFGDEDPSISLAASTTTAVLEQGGTQAVTLEIGRTNFENPIQLAVEGTLPAGLTANFAQNPIAAGSNTTTLTITATGSATPGTAAITIKATGEGIAEKTIQIDVTINVRGSHTVALTNSTMNVAQGGGGQSTVLLARQNSNAGSVTLSATGAPSGMTVTFGESPTTSAATSVTVVATAAVAPGSYNISIAGSQPGLTPSPAPATLAVTVIGAPSTTSMSIPFCSSGMPVWFAYQNEGFLWQRVTASGNAFTFAASDKLAIAFTFQSGGASDVRFYYATRSELAGLNDRDCFGPKTHPGTTANVGSGQTALVTLGSAFAFVNGNSFLLEGVADRPLDLVATRANASASAFTPDRMVVRRGVNLANGATIPVVDYTGGESFVPVSNTLSIAGAASGETVYSENIFQGSTGTTGLVYAIESSSTSHAMFSVPASSLVAGDLSELYIDAYNASGTVAHTMVTYFTTPGDRSETLGPLLTTPTVTLASTTPYVRERGQLSSQADYGSAARFRYLQGQGSSTKLVMVVVSANHLGGTAPATWDLVIPDLSGVTGFSSSWMHTTGQTTAFSAEAFSAPGSTLFGGQPSVGQTIKLAYRESSFTTSIASALRATTLQQRSTVQKRAMPERRGAILNPPPQYLRR